MNKCYKCGEQLNKKNASKEHIIQDSLGGNITSYNLLCNTCNSFFGESIDKELNRQLKPFIEQVVSKHPNKKTRTKLYTKEGEEHIFDKNLQPLPKFKIISKNNREVVHHVQSEKELDKLIMKKRGELKDGQKIEKKYYDIPPSDQLFFFNSKNINGKLFFGGEDYHKAIIKIAVNYYLSIYNNQECIKEAIDILRGNVPFRRQSEFYYPTNYQVHTLAEDEVSNIIYLKGNTDEKLLICYIELLNSECLIVFLNMNYEGPNIESIYVHDVRKQLDLKKEINIKLKKHHIEVLHLIDSSSRHEIANNRLIRLIERQSMEII